ncbi:MAG TPA: Spy/CpxP family protein refolding chaperone [Pyrinomonadaceae bacterium]|nr:Spy/CpxP family protein refolding chaperone [Pyrinomonadaceae bacterium]
MKKKILVIASIAVLVVAAAVFVLAQGHMGGGDKMRGGPGDMIEHISRELSLTDAQKEQVKAAFEAQRAVEEERHAKLDEIRKQIDAATANGQFDEAVVRPLANQQAQLQAESMIDHLRMHAKLYSLLNAEQKVKADEMMKRHGGPGHGPGGPGGDRHHGPPPAPGF